MSGQYNHGCDKAHCAYCYEMWRINQPTKLSSQTISEMIAAAILQCYMINQVETVGRNYSHEVDKYLTENITLPSKLLAKNIGRSPGAVRMRKVYLRKQST